MWYICFFFFKQKTAYEMRISDWSSDVCSSDLSDIASSVADPLQGDVVAVGLAGAGRRDVAGPVAGAGCTGGVRVRAGARAVPPGAPRPLARVLARSPGAFPGLAVAARLFPRRGNPAPGRAEAPAALLISALAFATVSPASPGPHQIPPL